MPSSHHIVVVGGGIAGLAIASKLPRTSWLIVAPLRSNDETSEQARTGQR
jgi:glycine/D-amino acid oxidase-like deaminating enzyme